MRPAAADGVLGDSYAANGPGLSSAGSSQGQATLRSVIVNRDDSRDTVRSAQAQRYQTPTEVQPGTTAPPALQPGASAPVTQPGSSVLDSIRQPFGSQTEPSRPTMPEPTRQPGDREYFPADQGLTRPAMPEVFQPGGGTMMPRTEPEPLQGLGAPGMGADAEEQRTKEVCTEQLNKLRTSSLAEVRLDISIPGAAGRDYPHECSIDDGTWHAGRSWPGTTYMWKASALCHKPLYFEDEQMERYGHSWGPCCDPLVAGAHFFTRLPVLPYCMGLTPPCECVYALGHYRPGSCAPRQLDPVPLSWRAALIQAGAVTGTAAILP